MNQGISLIVYPVKDLAQAKTLYSAFLGVEPYVDGPYYVGFKVGEQEFGLDPNGHSQGITGPVSYREVIDIHVARQLLLDSGAQMQREVQDVGNGLLICILKDADNNFIGLRQ